jgi:hypothetical protein
MINGRNNRRSNRRNRNTRNNRRIGGLSFSDRIGRLVLMTAILGGLSVFYTKALSTILSTLTTKIYLQSFFNTEHILASGMLSTGVLVLIYAIWYCYCELLTLNHMYKSNNESIKIIHNADKNYGQLFEIIKLYVTSSVLITVLSTFVIGFIVKNYIIIGSFFFFLLILSIILIVPKSRKVIINKKVLIFFKTNGFAFSIWLVVTFIMFCALFIAMSSHQKSVFKIDFSSNTNLPINFHFKSSVPERINVSYYSIDNKNKITLTKKLIINESDFSHSFVEVTEKPETSTNLSWLKVIDKEIKKSQETALISNISKYDYKYELNSINYFKKGQNFVIIEFVSNYGLSNKFYKIVNQIDVIESGVKITTESFE